MPSRMMSESDSDMKNTDVVGLLPKCRRVKCMAAAERLSQDRVQDVYSGGCGNVWEQILWRM